MRAPNPRLRNGSGPLSLRLMRFFAEFIDSFDPHIAVRRMIPTCTEVKPIECVFSLRNVKSAGFFETKGRNVRVISPDKRRHPERQV